MAALPLVSEKRVDVAAVGSWTNFDHLFVVDKIPRAGDTVQITSEIGNVEKVLFGGCAPNNAAVVAKLGAKSAWVGVAGEDFVTRGYAAYFEDLGVSLAGTRIVEQAQCGHSFLYSDPDGQSICLSHLGIASRQEEFDPDPEVLQTAAVAVINYRFDRYTLKAADIVRKSGGLVVVSGALQTAPAFVREFCSTTDILICTAHELRQVADHLGLEDPRHLFELGLKAMIATRGRDGSQVITPDLSVEIPIVPAVQVVDPTGAGDAFVGGVAFGLARRFSLVEAARFGAVVASFVVEALGCQTNLPTYSQASLRYQSAFMETPPALAHVDQAFQGRSRQD